MFFKHFASKNQLPDFYISGTLVENGLNMMKALTLNLSNLSRYMPTEMRHWHQKSKYEDSHDIFVYEIRLQNVKKVVVFLANLDVGF